MKKRFSLGSISMESFDQAPTGNVLPNGQPVNPEQPLITAGYTETIPGGNTGNYAAEVKLGDPKKILSAPALESNDEHEAAELWKRICSAFEVTNDHDKVDMLELNPAVSDSALNALEVYAHGKLSPLLVELLKIHNGQRDWTVSDLSPNAESILPHISWFFSAERMLAASKDMMGIRPNMDKWYGPVTADPRIQAVQWSPKWLVLGANEDNRGVFYVLDYDPTPKGRMGQMIKVDLDGNSRLVLADSFEAWFRGFVNRLSHHNHASLESLGTPRYPLVKPALEDDAVVIDDDELDALVSQANALTKTCDNTAEIALEAASDLAKSKMHLRFKRLKDSFADSFKSTNAMITKYRARLDELKKELSGTVVHGQLEVNMSGLWQHFSTEAGPVTSNLVGKVREDVAFSRYILTDFSQKAFEELAKLNQALHTGQGNSDDEAKRTALDVEKCSGPAEYMNQKWLCPAGEQPYLSVTGIYGRQGRYPRAVAISGVSLDRLAQLSTHYYVREYGSFLHGMKKFFTHDSKKTTRLSENDLEQLIKLGEEYLAAAEHYLVLYNKVWPIFRHIDDSLDQIWDDFGLTEYEIELDDGDKDGYKTTVSWQESDTGPVERRAKVFDQLMGVVRNFSDATIMPGFHEMTRALRAAKYHTYIVAAGLKAAKSTAMESMMVPSRLGGKIAQEFFWNSKPHELSKPASYVPPKYKDIPKPEWDVKRAPSIQESLKALRAAMQEHDPEGLKTFNRPATAQELQKLEALVKQHTGKALPPQLVELYKITNGGVDRSGHLRLFDFDEFMPIHEVISTYETQLSLSKEDWAGEVSEIETGMQGKQFWEPWWIPFTASGSGDYFCADVNPGSGGQVGQVIDWSHDFDARRVAAPSIAAFLALSVHRQLYLLNHKKDWDAKNGSKPEIKPGRQDDKPAGM